MTASGEIKPRNYINIGANAQGRIIELLVKEGDHVRKNQVVARIEHIQAQADVQAQKAAVASAQADSAAAEDGLRAADESIKTAASHARTFRSELERAKIAARQFGKTLPSQADREAGLRPEEGRLRFGRGQRARERSAAVADESAARADGGAA